MAAAEVNVRFGSKADALEGSAISQKRTLAGTVCHLAQPLLFGQHPLELDGRLLLGGPADALQERQLAGDAQTQVRIRP